MSSRALVNKTEGRRRDGQKEGCTKKRTNVGVEEKIKRGISAKWKWKGKEQGIARGADERNGWRDWAEGEDSWQSMVIIRRLCE